MQVRWNQYRLEGMTYWTDLDNIGRTSVELKDRDVIIIGPGLIYTTKHSGLEYSIKSRFAPESEEEDALIDMCQDLHREFLKLAEKPAKN